MDVTECELIISNNGLDIVCQNDGSKKIQRQTVFQSRRTIITRLLESEDPSKVTNARGLYNAVVALMLYAIIGLIFQDYVKYGKFTFGWRIISSSFENMHWAFLIWIGMVLHIYLCFGFFIYWYQNNKTFKEHKRDEQLKHWNLFWTLMLILFYIEYLCFPLFFTIIIDFGVPAKIAIFMEQLRMLMKIHGYVRTKPTFQPKQCRTFIEDFYSFSYYLMAPTLLYRDTYPRSKNRSFRRLFAYAIEFLFGLYFLALVLEKTFLEKYEYFGTEYVPWINIVYWILQTIPILYVIIFTKHYLLFEIWMNFWAELLKFDDRHFYENWWSATGLSIYFRKWNCIVYEWLHKYIYLGFSEKLFPKRLARFIVILISDLFHEYFITSSVGSCVMIMFFNFLTSEIWTNIRLKWMPRPLANFIFHCGSSLGVSLIINLHFMEYYARINCPSTLDSAVLDFFTPRYLICNMNNGYETK